MQTEVPICRTRAFSLLAPAVSIYRMAPITSPQTDGVFNMDLGGVSTVHAAISDRKASINYEDQRYREFARFFERLDDLRELRSNWDSYGAEAPNVKADFWTREVLRALLHENLVPTQVSPSVENGIGISFSRHGKYADIECFNNGDILAVTSNGSGDPNVWHVGPNDEDIRHAIEYIRRFLEA